MLQENGVLKKFEFLKSTDLPNRYFKVKVQEVSFYNFTSGVRDILDTGSMGGHSIEGQLQPVQHNKGSYQDKASNGRLPGLLLRNTNSL